MNLTTFVGRLWTRVNDHDIFGRAAQLSYYFLLAVFPLLLFLVTLLGYFAEAGSQLRNKLLSYLATVMPGAAITLVRTTLDEISQARGGGKLSLGILAALWAASNGMGAISNTLNVAYAVREDRPWWKVRLIAIFLTITVTLFILVAWLLFSLAVNWVNGLRITSALARRLRLLESAAMAHRFCFCWGPSI